MKPIYLDYNATTPVLPEIAEVMRPFFNEYFGNPSSSHIYGKVVKEAIELARKRMAGLLNCKPEEIVFTSGGSESNNFAIKGIAFKNRSKGNHIITSSVEHPAVKEVCEYLKAHGFEVTYLPVDEWGMVDLNEFKKVIKIETIMITIMHSNNEIGSIQPINEISELARKHNIVFHTDAAQSVGKIKTNVQEMGVDLLSVAGHKLYAPKGVGALYIKTGIELEKLIHGAKQEKNRRAGTENIMEIAGLGKACEIAYNNLEMNVRQTKEMRNRLENGLKAALKNHKINGKELIKINGHPTDRLPNTLSISFLGIDATTLLARIENEVAASAGSACHAEGVHISDTLSAMQVPVEYAMGTLRLSTGKITTEQEIDKTINVISSTVKNMLQEKS
jgi:cysteine desulfurase